MTIARAAKIDDSGPVRAESPPEAADAREEAGRPRDSRLFRELCALGLTALAAFVALSLLCLDLGREPNLGGPIGAILATALRRALGDESYGAIALALFPALALWTGSRWQPLLRVLIGAGVLLVALSAATALWGGAHDGGAIGDAIAAALVRYLSFGGGYLVVVVALVGGLAVMAGRAPTDLLGALSSLSPLRRQNSDDSSLATFGSDEAFAAPAASDPPKLRRLDRAEAGLRDGTSRALQRPRVGAGYRLPALDLLDAPPARHNEVDDSLLERSARVLEEKLADFGVVGRVAEVQPGPVITMYKFEPGSGIKVSQIVNLADDLSMALRAQTVRIQAPVPGEAVVGIEVPNRRREKVYLREILESDQFAAAQSQLTIALGKDIAGMPVVADLARMPHLLIAGATGAGKSVSIHAMLASILFNATAEDVRFILIDPKMLELSVYDNIPHLLVPVVIDPTKAAAALLWANQEMENRFLLMRDLGVRNLDGYNRALDSKTPIVELRPASRIATEAPEPSEAATTPLEHRKLPKIVIVIDELADLLLSEGKTVERDITRLAQKARAAGIHLILATQRPSVDVITGLIKANLPARLSFQVTSRVDSRTILDTIGSERLLGEGDMLFMPPGSAKLRRLHGPFVSEIEIRRLTDFLRVQGTPDYQMEILETRAEAGEDGEYDDIKDELYDEAVKIVLEAGQASISMIQRRLRIGYNRSARMVERMEREGIVAPADGAKPRKVRGLR